MHEISASVKKLDHDAKVCGEAMYVGDFPTGGVLYGKLLHSSKARAEIAEIHLPELPEGYLAVDKNDVPGDNNVNIVLDDCPVFARDTVEYIGEAVLMIAGPDEKQVERLVEETQVIYRELSPVLKTEDSDTVFFDYAYEKGDIEAAFAQADFIMEEKFFTGYQEQAYLETQGIIAVPAGDRMTIRGSLQCPYYVYGAVARALGCEREQVRIVQDVTGGGFGGKEDYPSILACQAAVAAKKAGKPVRAVFDRREDMEFTSKRHPSECTYKVAVKNGKITAMDADVLFNAGAYTTLSSVVLQRGIIAAQGVYKVDNLKVRGRAVKTNTVPCGAFRGFGAPQVFFAVEMMMNHVAARLGEDSLAFKARHLARQGDATSTGGKYHFPVPMPDMIRKVCDESDYSKKRAEYALEQSGRFRRGIGMSLFFHGAGFTGTGEREIIKAVVRLRKYPDGKVEVLAANSDMGQGVKTTFAKIVAHELGIGLENVIFENPDTDRVPDSGPTVASRSVMTVGELLRRAAARLREQWLDGQEQQVEERYSEPDFMESFDMSKFHGDAYPTYAWGVSAVEAEVDTFTGKTRVAGAWGCYDVGTPIDYNVVVGQMEGGLLQGIGYASIEKMDTDETGRIRNNSFSDYIIPTSMDVPELKVIMHVQEYPYGPYGAKGAGELPLVGVPGAYAQAMEQALKTTLRHVPFTAEDTIKALAEVEK